MHRQIFTFYPSTTEDEETLFTKAGNNLSSRLSYNAANSAIYATTAVMQLNPRQIDCRNADVLTAACLPACRVRAVRKVFGFNLTLRSDRRQNAIPEDATNQRSVATGMVRRRDDILDQLLFVIYCRDQYVNYWRFFFAFAFASPGPTNNAECRTPNDTTDDG